MTKPVHLLKLCVGEESVEGLSDWYRSRPSPFPTGERRHVTRMWPRREAEVLAGGSLYWGIQGVILCPQRILDGILRCGMVLDPGVIRTEAAARGRFQGWRYLDPVDARRDLPKERAADSTLPEAMALALSEIGLR